MPAKRLVLEVTETLIMVEPRTMIPRLRALKELGVRLAIDDFGTGYANLANVRSLPVHALKLAGQFVHDLPVEDAHDSAEAAFLEILVTLGHTLGLTVIAEGVETAGQADVLRAIGCDYGQGYHLGLPRPPDQF
jgi:EAL domain-containing protein (putative c-di-GMP-specific phosphodiesterase class I)